MELVEWVNSLENPTRARYAAARLWQQGLRAGDKDIIMLCHGYTEHEAEILSLRLAELEAIAEHRLADYNPDIGF